MITLFHSQGGFSFTAASVFDTIDRKAVET
jgi:hypothetical protein